VTRFSHATCSSPPDPACGSTRSHAAGREAGLRLARLIENRDLATVCGWNYVMDYDQWSARLARWVANEVPAPAGDGQRYVCEFCGLIYDPARDLPEDGIAPGTAFEDIPDNWRCADCGVEKASFVTLD
jgi:rubredoxin